MNKSVKTLDELDHQNTPEECSHQNDANVSFTLGEQTFVPVGFIQRNKGKMAYRQFCLHGIGLGWFLRLYDFYKKDWCAFVSAFKKQFLSTKNCLLHTLKLRFHRKRKLETYAITL